MAMTTDEKRELAGRVLAAVNRELQGDDEETRQLAANWLGYLPGAEQHAYGGLPAPRRRRQSDGSGTPTAGTAANPFPSGEEAASPASGVSLEHGNAGGEDGSAAGYAPYGEPGTLTEEEAAERAAEARYSGPAPLSWPSQ